MKRGWEVTLKDNTILSEDIVEWKKVPKAEIKMLSLLYDGRRWDLLDREAYFIRNSASMVPGVQESFQVEKRAIGYYEGNTKVLYVINEHTGKFDLVVEGG